MNELDLKKLKNPDAEYRSAPFWSWNGKLEPERIKKQVGEFGKSGMGGFFPHSRSGLKTEYLSDEWFECIDSSISEADKLGMKAYLYDEDRYSSGMCGGAIAKISPEFRLRHLTVNRVLHDEDELLARFLIEFDSNGEIISYRKADKNADVLENETAIFFCVSDFVSNSHWYNDSAPADLCNSDAVKAFVSKTHEEYYKRYSDSFGTVIPAIFTDEVCVSFLPSGKIYSDTIASHHWTSKYDEIFKNRFGYNFIDYLPEIFFSCVNPKKPEVARDYVLGITNLFEENYSCYISDWCEKHNVSMTGHLYFASFFDFYKIGNPMTHFKYWQCPGMDILTDTVGKLSAFKMTASSSHQYNKRMICETYGCTGWDWPLEKHLFHAGWQFCLGVNFRSQHLSHYTLEGWGKKDYPASISTQSPWFKYYNVIEDSCGRISYALTRGKYDAHILVLSPYHTVMSLYHGCHRTETYDKYTSKLITLSDKWDDLVKQMIENHIDFDFGDTDIMLESELENGHIKIGQMSYDTVVVMSGTEPDNKLLEKLKNIGVKVLLQDNYNNIIDELPREISITHNGKECPDVWSTVRDVAGKKSVFLQSMSDKKQNVKVEFVYKSHVIQYDTLDNNFIEIDNSSKNKINTFSIDLNPYCSKLFFIGDFGLKGIETKSSEFDIPIKLTEYYDYRLSELNSLPLDFCRYSVNGNDFSHQMPICKAESEIIEMYGLDQKEFYNSCQPWFINKNKYMSFDDKITIEISFNVSFVPKECYLAMESKSQYNGVFVNNKPLGENVSYFIDEDIKTYDISDKLFIGENKISVSLNYSTDTELENLYVIGQFAVEKIDKNKDFTFDNLTISNMHEKISSGSGAHLYNRRRVMASG